MLHCGRYCRLALVVAAMMLFTGALALTCADLQQFSTLTSVELAAIRVGDPGINNRCCTKSTLHDCSDNAAFTCAENRACTDGETFDSTCDPANCGTVQQGYNCATTSVQRSETQCVVNGSTADGCPAGQTKCTYYTNAITVTVTACSSNGQYCPSGQPQYSCD